MFVNKMLLYKLFICRYIQMRSVIIYSMKNLKNSFGSRNVVLQKCVIQHEKLKLLKTFMLTVF